MADTLLSARVARQVRAILAQRKITQERLAEATGIPMRTLARRLHRTHPSALSIEELALIADALGLGIVDLLPDAIAKTAAARTPPTAARPAASAIERPAAVAVR
ncbi:helix-turn-helix domain-containing protein [Microbacterium radiodurans]|uniref:Helix-turn-helix transcriptional regulator n=1 Tax=Microbacterium radiodurans TaxID=661398 RepID=A0A5J5IR37_9MICO|nr:helix-turn-helix transcriptional regulator [Microbacterium radiodurans]KAA9085375.1 helix-turn-helix transcriptional regulator [Microbacterium radiodurans]